LSSDSSGKFHEDRSNDSCDNEDEVIELPEIEDTCKDDDEDKGQLDEQALARFKAQEEGNEEPDKCGMEEIDFHPDEPRPPSQFMYSAYFENLRHTMNTFLRKPIKKQFITNSKKCVLLVEKN